MRHPLSFVIRRPGWVLWTVGLFSLFALTRIVDLRSGELRITFDPSTNALLPRDDEGRRFYDRTRRIFGSDETILVALVDEDVFTTENLHRLERMTRRFNEIEGVHHVVSLTNALDIRAEYGELIIEPFAEEIPEDPAALERIRRRALANQIYAGNLVSRDSRATAVMVYLMDISESEFLRRGIDHQIDQIAEEEKGGAEVWITGPAYVKAEMSRVLLEDLTGTLPLAALALLLVSLLRFRNLVGALLPLIAVGIALLWTLALVALFGQSLNVITVVLPPLILVVGFAYSVHVVADYHEVIRQGHGADAAQGPVDVALRMVALPLIVTGLTTIAGFLSLAISPLSAIREFGLFATAGVAATLVVSVTFTPAALQLLRPTWPRETGSASLFDRVAPRVAEFDLQRRAPILVTASVIALLSLVGISRIRISTDVIALFDPESRVRRHYEAINEHLQGSDALYIVLEADYRDAFKEPVNLELLQDLQRWLESQPEIGGTTSLVDYLMLINRGFHDDDPTYLTIPESKRLTSQLLLFGGNDELESYVDSQFQMTSILTRSQAIDSGTATALVERIERRLEQIPGHLRARVTGNSVLINKTSDEIALGQSLGLALAFAMIFLILCILFMSIRVGMLALIPNALPVLVYFGALGFTGVTLNTTTGLVACLVLGIAVDDTIHFLARFNASAKRYASEAKGVHEALWTVGRPVTYTTLALCLGFLTLTTSQLQNQREFGALAAFTLGFAWLVDIVFTPALAARMRVVTLWDMLTLDLGEDPQSSIPLLKGLTQHQARLAVLMTSLRHHGAGEKLIRTGDEGDELFVIIHGSLVATVPGKEGTESVALGRGDVVGEIGLFHGRRTVDVDTVTEATLMRLTLNNLERLRRRYPWIAAKLYRNLSHVLADRMAVVTERAR